MGRLTGNTYRVSFIHSRHVYWVPTFGQLSRDSKLKPRLLWQWHGIDQQDIESQKTDLSLGFATYLLKPL